MEFLPIAFSLLNTIQALAAGLAAFFITAFAIGYSMDPPY
jgi:hypothetical protein